MKKLENGWEQLKSEKGPNIGLLQARYDYLKNPRNQKEIRVFVLEGLDAVNAIAVTKDKKIILVRQLRFGTKDLSIEPPGGLMDVGEEKLAAVQRELREETGYTGTKWSFLTTLATQPVFMNNYIHTYVLLDATLTHPLEMDDGEDIEILEFSIEEIKNMLKNGGFIHPHAVSAITIFLLKYDLM